MTRNTHPDPSPGPIDTPRRSVGDQGFTLIELVAAIAIIVIVTGVLLPAIQRVREAANRMQAARYLTELGTSMQEFHRAHGQFPESWPRILELINAPVDGAVSGFQLIPEAVTAHELIVTAEPIAGVTGSETLTLHVTPTADGSRLHAAPMAGAEAARSRMLQRLFNFTSQEIAALVYLLPRSEHDAFYETIVPSLQSAATSGDVLAGLHSLGTDGIVSLNSLFARGDEIALGDSALEQRFGSLLHGARAILGIGTYNEGLHHEGISIASALAQNNRLAEVIYSFGALGALTHSYLSDERGRKAGGFSADQAFQIERELLQLLTQAAAADERGDEAQKARWLAQYIALLVKMEGVLLSQIQVDALSGIARSL